MLTAEVNDLAAAAGVRFFDWQVDTFAGVATQTTPLRVCLYYKTGAGKSLTSLVCVRLAGFSEAVVITPPATYPQWERIAAKLGITVQLMSHAKFRMKDTKLSRSVPVIADEMHLFGGHGGKGWKKLDSLAGGLQAPLVLASATPNYNDAERVYCVKHILDPNGTKGGYLEFLYRECETTQNPFRTTPDVTGFRNHADAAEFLASLPGVYYLPDDVVYTIDDVRLPEFNDPSFVKYGYDRFTHRIMASIIEAKHRRIFNNFVDPNGYLNDEAYEILKDMIGNASTPTLVFAAHSTVARALGRSLSDAKVRHAVITGETTAKNKQAYLDAFRSGSLEVLVGTASLATGTDGLDKVCDCLVILDDTDDAALRRQLIGRIMPRGTDTDATLKQVYRLVLS